MSPLLVTIITKKCPIFISLYILTVFHRVKKMSILYGGHACPSVFELVSAPKSLGRFFIKFDTKLPLKFVQKFRFSAILLYVTPKTRFFTYDTNQILVKFGMKCVCA
jgi:hypothetical protein